jgi:site-specific recombinase XerD
MNRSARTGGPTRRLIKQPSEDHTTGSNTRVPKERTTGSVSRRALDTDLMTRTEIESIIQACSNRAPSGIRNRAIIATTWRCGLRISETLGLEVKAVDLQNGTLVVQHGKGDKRRVVGIDPGTAELVRRWMKTRSTAHTHKIGAPLFCTLQGKQIDPSYIRHLLPRLAVRAGIEKRVHAHALRHSFALELEGEGAPLSTIRDALGHSSAAVTDRYLRRVSGGQAAAIMRQRTWAL